MTFQLRSRRCSLASSAAAGTRQPRFRLAAPVAVAAWVLVVAAAIGLDAVVAQGTQTSARGTAQAPARSAAQAAAVASFDAAWGTIDDTYYDPTFHGLDWVAIRDELRPRVEAAETPDAARAVIREMLSRLGQSHFSLLTPSAADASPRDASVLIEVRIADGDVVIVRVPPDSAAMTAGVRPGAVIRSIDGVSVQSMRPSTGAPDAARTEDADRSRRAADLAWWQAVTKALAGAGGSTARLDLAFHDGGRQSVSVPRETERGERVALGNMPVLYARERSQALSTPGGRRVGLVAFNVWLPAIAQPFADAIDRFRHADGLVIDLRGNPGGLAEMMRGIAGHLIDEPDLIGRVRMRDVELEFRANPRRSTADGRRVEPYDGPVAILVDELSGSTSECFAGGLQSLGRARVFGMPTMGQALPAATRDLPNGDVLLYVIGDFVTATGRRLEGDGVEPDERVPVNPRMLAAGRDGPLEAALQWIDGLTRLPAPATR